MKALSDVQKKIIYLDQCLLSRMVKMLDPDFPEYRRVNLSFDFEFVHAAFDKLHRLVKLQLVVCPHSPFHRSESTVLDPAKPAGFTQHKRIWELLSGRASFTAANAIRNAQLLRKAKAWLEGIPTVDLCYRDALNDNAFEWPDSKFRVTLKWPASEHEIDENRLQIERYRQKIPGLYAKWREQRPSFATLYEAELRAFGQLTRHFFIKFLEMRSNVVSGDLQATSEFGDLMMKSELSLLRSLRECFQEHGVLGELAIESALNFLDSKEAFECPYIQLSSILYASLARRVIEGHWGKSDDVPFNDVSAISAYMPYCDAIFVDSQMHGLLKSRRVKGLSYCKAVVFSTDNKDEFLAYLDSILNAAPARHLEIVKRLYGERWLEPYFDVLKHDKARQADDDEE